MHMVATVATLVSCFFAFAGGLAVFAIVFTTRSHAGAWDKLGEERRMLRDRDRLAAQGAELAERYPATVDARPIIEPVGAIVYNRRFTGRSAPALLQLPKVGGLRAAA